MDNYERFNRLILARQELTKLRPNLTYIARLIAENEFEEGVFETLSYDKLVYMSDRKWKQYWEKDNG